VLPSYDFLSRFLLSFGLIDDLDWFELYVLFWCCPMVPFVPRTREGFSL
jgi:hypothetical protein